MSASPQLLGRYLAGRCSDGAERGRGKLRHFVPPGSMFSAAACKAKPGRLSGGWSDTSGFVTCPRCLRAIEKHQREMDVT